MRKLILIVILCACATGCGSSGRPTGSASASRTSAPPPARHDLAVAAAPDGALAYTRSSLVALAGTVRIRFTNDTPVAHDLAVQRGTSGSALGATPVFSGGSRTLTLHLAPGRYTYYCTVPGHRASGMLGTLRVVTR